MDFVSGSIGKHLSKTHLVRRSLVTASAIFIAGCNDAPTGIGPAPKQPATMVVCEDPSGACDGSINPNDSQIYANVTVQLTTTAHSDIAFEDPVSGQTVTDLTLDNPPEHLSVSAGYSDAGDPVVITASQDPVDPSGTVADQVTGMKLVGNNVLSTNTYGQTVTSDDPPELGTTTPLDLLGDMTGASVTDNIVVDVTGDNTPDNVGNRLPSDPARLFAAFSRSVDDATMGAKPVFQLIAPDRLQVTALSKESPSDPGITNIRKFHKDKEGKKWILDEIRVESEDVDDHRKLKQVSVTTFKDVRWFENKDKDKQRRKARPTNAVIPLATPSQPTPLLRANSLRSSLGSPRFLQECGDECGGGGSVGGSPDGWDPGPEIGGCVQYAPDLPFPSPFASPDGPDTRGNPAPFPNAWGPVHPDGTNIVWQHGIFSSAGTWCDMERYARNNVRIGYEMRFSLRSWQDTYEDQATDLLSRVNENRAGNSGFIFIGHSNGGIVSRQVAHITQDASLVRGVITIDSPHHGAPIAAVADEAVKRLLAPIIGVAGCRLVGHQICNLIGGAPAAAIAAYIAPLALSASSPVLRELNPHSNFWPAFNAVPESFFRAGIQSNSWNKWTEWRMYGDAGCAPIVSCGGRSKVKFVDQKYHFAIKCSIVGALAGFFWHPSWAVAAGCAKLAAQMKGLDLVYKRLTVGGDSGDGLVPLQSQYYPNADRQYTIEDGDSHVGVLRGVDKSGSRVTAALADVFGVILR